MINLINMNLKDLPNIIPIFPLSNFIIFLKQLYHLIFLNQDTLK